MGYTASPTPAATYNLPNVLANYGGWTTPIYLVDRNPSVRRSLAAYAPDRLA
jgi:hypothetical protein